MIYKILMKYHGDIAGVCMSLDSEPHREEELATHPLPPRLRRSI